VAPVRNPTFVTLSDGSIRNTYDVRLRNKNGEDRPFHISLTSDSLLRISLEGKDDLVVDVPADETLLQRVYVTAPAGSDAATTDRTPFRIWVEDLESNEHTSNDTIFNGVGQ
jgi:hypothetical protein